MTDQPDAHSSPPPAAEPPVVAEPSVPAPPPAMAAPVAPPPAPAKPASKWRVAIPLVIIGGFLAVVLWAVKDNEFADDLAIGTCFDVPTQTSISTVTKHACTEAHDAEVFHIGEMTGESGSYPISLTVDRFVTENCEPTFITYVGEAAAAGDLTFGYFYPSRDGWEDGERSVTCYALRLDEAKLTQSVKAGG